MNAQERQVVYRITNPRQTADPAKLIGIPDPPELRFDAFADMLAAIVRGESIAIVARSQRAGHSILRDPFFEWPLLRFRGSNELTLDVNGSGRAVMINALAHRSEYAGHVFDRVYYELTSREAVEAARYVSKAMTRPTAAEELEAMDKRIKRLKGQIAELEADAQASRWSEAPPPISRKICVGLDGEEYYHSEWPSAGKATITVKAIGPIRAGELVAVEPPAFDVVGYVARFIEASVLEDEAMAALGKLLAELVVETSPD